MKEQASKKQTVSENLWTEVDEYIENLLLPSVDALEHALARSKEAGLPAINVAPNQGKFLHMMARMNGARRILEIGTLGGYSTIWLARALPDDGKLITLEFDEGYAEVAKSNFEYAGLTNVIEVRVGNALQTLPKLLDEKQGPFDVIFIDADKPNNPEYFAWSLKLSRVGTLIIVDNVIRWGAIVDRNSSDPRVQGTQRFFEVAAAEPRVMATALQTVGAKGHDGFAVLLVVG